MPGNMAWAVLKLGLANRVRFNLFIITHIRKVNPVKRSRLVPERVIKIARKVSILILFNIILHPGILKYSRVCNFEKFQT